MYMLALYLIAMIAVRRLLYYFFSSMGLGFIAVDFLVDLIFSFLYAVMSYRGDRRYMYKDKNFYKTWASIMGMFILITVLGTFIELLLMGILPLDFVWIALIIDFLIALTFSIWNYPGYKKECFKDPRFHQYLLTYFVVLAGYTLLELYVLG